jgi:hypothetical protein
MPSKPLHVIEANTGEKVDNAAIATEQSKITEEMDKVTADLVKVEMDHVHSHLADIDADVAKGGNLF